MNRRHFLRGSAAAAAAGILPPSVSGVIQESTIAQNQELGRPVGLLASTNSPRSEFVDPQRIPLGSGASLTPLGDLPGLITPSDLHYEVHHSGIPAIDPDAYSLTIHGMVDRPLSFSLADLKRLPSVTRIAFLECSGNLFPRGTSDELTPGHVAGLTSQSEWTGVALSTLLREVGAQDGATWFLAEGADAGRMSRSIPMRKGLDDAIIAYAQNGEPLRPSQGYPVRLFLPGWEGNANVKWLHRIELADRPFMTRFETAQYSDPIREGRVRQFSFVMDARSLITSPTYPLSLERGWHEVRGIAWSGRGRVTGVEVSTDDGRNWAPARIDGPLLAKAHTRFSFNWRWGGEETVILSRATDETGYVQPSFEELVRVRGGRGSRYHFNPILGWRVRADGQVLFDARSWA